jgi:hypothetical protein
MKLSEFLERLADFDPDSEIKVVRTWESWGFDEYQDCSVMSVACAWETCQSEDINQEEDGKIYIGRIDTD